MTEKTGHTKEIEVAETVFIRDIETRVFQIIVLRTLATIEGIALLEGTFMDHMLGKSSQDDHLRGIIVEQSEDANAVSVRVEINIVYGLSIPEKAEEIQNAIVESIYKFTGLHVGRVHLVIKGVVSQPVKMKELASLHDEEMGDIEELPPILAETLENN